MDPREIYKSKKKSLDEFLDLIRPKDKLAASIAGGQPRTLLNHLSNKKDIEAIEIFTGLIAFPYPAFAHPNVRVTSGYYGPIDRTLNDMGANLSYMPLAFNDFEMYVEGIFSPRVILSTLSAMDEDGYLSFGIDSEAAYLPFVKAARDPNRLAIAEVNPQMPVVRGIPELGDNRIHISEIDAVIESDQSIMEIPPLQLGEVEKKIAQNVVGLIRSGDTLQFGIGALPNEVASILAKTDAKDLGIYSELISDGFLTLMESGKITNTQKGFHDGKSLFAFALGSKKLYDWLDERNGQNKGRAVAVPVSYLNEPYHVAQNRNLKSVNSGFMIDFSGQVSAEAIGEKQYSGVGGQFNFVQGAFHSLGGFSILCFKSSVVIEGKRYSNIVDAFPPGTIVSTPRHYTQYVVTEYGVVNLYGLSDEERGSALIPLAHPDFRTSLTEQAKNRDRVNYKSRLSK